MNPSLHRALIALSIAGSAACGEAGASGPAPKPETTMPSAAARPAPPPVSEPPPDAGAKAGCPSEMAAIEGFCIDRHEAHLWARGPGGAVTLHPHSQRPEAGVTYEARSSAGVYPQAYVSRVESESACRASGKRLCTMREWQRACQGRQKTSYPYAERWQPNRCNMDKQHLITLRLGADPRRWRYRDFNDPSLAEVPGFLAKTGEYAACVGEAGVYDLVGNLHEWVSDTADAALVKRLEAEDGPRQWQPFRAGNGVFMGGFFSTREEHGRGCRFTTFAHEPSYHDYSTGFRCCADAPAGG